MLVLFPLTVATFVSSERINTVLQVGDIDNTVRRIPKLNPQDNVSTAEADLLTEIDDSETPLSISEIATAVDKAKSTVARHVDKESFVATAKE